MSGESQIHGSPGGDVSLIETLRYDPVAGLIRKSLHLERLSNSAKALGFEFDKSRIENALQDCTTGNNSLRIRIEMSHDGSSEVTATPFELQSAQTRWNVAIANTQIDSTDQLITHKTTRRNVYDAARAEFDAHDANEVILCNEHDQVCEGTITNIFVLFDGELLHTPPLSCGLLPGVLRRQLLSEAKAIETVLTRKDLASARKVFVGNSLRGLISADLV